MKRTFVLVLLAGLGSGASLRAVVDRPPKERADPLVALLAGMEKAAATLEAVHDEESAGRAVTELNAWAQQLQELSRALKGSPSRFRVKVEQLRSLRPKLLEARRRLMAASRNFRGGPALTELPPATYIRVMRAYRDLTRAVRNLDQSLRRRTIP